MALGTFALLVVGGFGGLLFAISALLVEVAMDITFSRRFERIVDRALGFGGLSCIVGLIGLGVIGAAAAAKRPLSRGIVAEKRIRSYTTMVWTGKVAVPTHHTARELISTEGAICSVESDAYDGYRVGDAVVCGWAR